MIKKERVDAELEDLIKDLKLLVELSFREDAPSCEEWSKDTAIEKGVHCWERMQCNQPACPAYKNESGRCWLKVGTLCGGEVQGKFAVKFGSCTNCEIYRESTKGSKVREMRELVISLVHSLRLRQKELKEAKSEVKILSGLLPICASCKKIRDEQGNWKQIESYIRDNSEAEFSHGICPECFDRLYPGLRGK